MTIRDIIAEITADIRAYQSAYGALIIFDPSSEAFRLCEIKAKLEREVR